jgi:hydrogenase expression/formation protein HypE
MPRTNQEGINTQLRFRDPQIEMAHGAGGKASRRLVEGLFAPLLFNGSCEQLGDAASFTVDGAALAITTDSFVVKPLRFPGGSIGELAVNGTVNDLAVSGARAGAIAVAFILEADWRARRSRPRFAPWRRPLASRGSES